MTLTRDRKADLLSAARLFDGVDAEGMERIAAVAVEVDFPADHVIARQGDIGTGFFVVVRAERVSCATASSSRGSARATSSASCRSSTGSRGLAQVLAEARPPAWRSRRGTSRRSSSRNRASPLAILRGVARRLRDLTEAHQH